MSIGQQHFIDLSIYNFNSKLVLSITKKGHFIFKKQTCSPCIFIAFDWKISSNDNTQISLSLSAEEKNMSTIEQGILEGVNHFIKKNVEREILIAGFDLSIHVDLFHTTDSSTIGYQMGIIQVLDQLVSEEDFKLIQT